MSFLGVFFRNVIGVTTRRGSALLEEKEKKKKGAFMADRVKQIM